MSREQRTRLNNMIAERAPASGVTPGKGTLTDELAEDTIEDAEQDLDEQVTEPARNRSVFDIPFARDLTAETTVEDPSEEAPTTKRRG